MEREFFSRLEEWKNDPQRRPLILEGPRGVGKTWLLRKLAEQFDAQVCLDFEQKTNSPLRYFPQAKNPVRMAQDLAAALCGTRGRKLVPGKSLLILDEPHMCPQALRALEHFSRELDIHVAAAL
ncbi:MAG: AAA family ATPase, partial [Desulfovibrionaceae bacterium]|nr:AAA family ATPase [Desulfovibrionaceae bacterium]